MESGFSLNNNRRKRKWSGKIYRTSGGRKGACGGGRVSRAVGENGRTEVEGQNRKKIICLFSLYLTQEVAGGGMI